MRLRPAVLLTLSESIHPPRLLSYRHIAPVSPLFSTLAKSAQPLHSRRFSFPLFSYTYALFCTFLHPPKTQLFSFQSLPHSLPKIRGVGVGNLQLPILELFVSFLTSLPPYLDTAKLGGANHIGALHV